MCNFWAQSRPFVLNKIFLVHAIVIIQAMYPPSSLRAGGRGGKNLASLCWRGVRKFYFGLRGYMVGGSGNFAGGVT